MSASASNRQRILIAEHDRQVRELLATLLHMEGYEPDQAETLEDALEKVDSQLYHVVLTDLFRLPNQPRLSTAQRLQQRCHPTPVGILTGWQVDQDEAKQAGFAFVLPKPFNIDELLERIAAQFNPPFSPAEEQQARIIRRSLQALSAGDWETMRRLLTPDVGYYPLTHSVFTLQREILGIEAYLAYAQLVRSNLPGFRIEQVVIFHHPTGLIARYRISWQGQDGKRQHLAQSAVCRFRGAHITQIGVSQPTQRFRALLKKDQDEGRV